MSQAALKYITPAEFIAREKSAETRSEYYRGEVFNMAGATFTHNLIALNVSAHLHAALKNTECFPIQNDLLVRIEAANLITYPDVMVICGQPVFYKSHQNVVTNPLLVVEVLSKSTGNYDRQAKFEFYRKLASFKEYVLIDQYKVHVEHYYLQGDGKWILTDYDDLNATLALKNVKAQISLKDIYFRVDFGS